MMIKELPNIANEPLRDFKSRQGLKVMRPFIPIMEAIGSANERTHIAKIKDIGLSQNEKESISTENGK